MEKLKRERFEKFRREHPTFDRLRKMEEALFSKKQERKQERKLQMRIKLQAVRYLRYQEQMTLTEIGRILNVTRERIRQILETPET